jgi:hypothetical protein
MVLYKDEVQNHC